MRYDEIAERTVRLIRQFDPQTKTFPPEAAEELRAFGRDCKRLVVFREQETAGRVRFAGMTAGEIFAQLEGWIPLAPSWEARLTMVVTTIPFVADALE